MTNGRKGALAYLDANVFIDFVEGAPVLALPARELFAALAAHDGIFVTSELVLAEVLAGARITPIERRLYMDLIVWNPLVLLAPVSREILIDASDLRRQAGHKLADAIHIATALRANCKFVVSRDRDMRKLPSALMALLDTGADAAKSLIEAANGR